MLKTSCTFVPFVVQLLFERSHLLPYSSGNALPAMLENTLPPGDSFFLAKQKTRTARTGKPRLDLRRLVTEQSNRASTDLDLKSSLELARIFNAEDAKVAAAVKRALPQIARAIDLIAAGCGAAAG